MSKHTAGPWSLRQGRNIHSPSEVIGRDGKPICELWARADFEKEKADARLIASAPELLDALIRLELHDRAANLRDGSDDCRELESARYAIAKARGEV